MHKNIQIKNKKKMNLIKIFDFPLTRVSSSNPTPILSVSLFTSLFSSKL